MKCQRYKFPFHIIKPYYYWWYELLPIDFIIWNLCRDTVFHWASDQLPFIRRINCLLIAVSIDLLVHINCTADQLIDCSKGWYILRPCWNSFLDAKSIISHRDRVYCYIRWLWSPPILWFSPSSWLFTPWPPICVAMKVTSPVLRLLSS